MELDLTQPSQLVPLLQKYGLYTQKSYGQHFLIDRNILTSIIQAADIQKDDTVIEVGTGTGVLTRELAARAAKVITFEIDAHLNQLLAETLADYPNVELHFEDFLKVNFASLMSSSSTNNSLARQPGAPDSIGVNSGDSTSASPVAGTDAIASLQHDGVINPPSTTDNLQPQFKFVANLPYNVGSHILDILIKSQIQPHSMTVLLQKEVAHKITARPPHATYLSNFMSLYGSASLVKTVKPGSFFPAPAVDSAILHVDRSPSTVDSQHTVNVQLSTVNPSAFSRFLHRGFAQPRKMLNKAFDPELLRSANIDPHQRPENLTFNDWLTLFRVVQS